MRAASPTRRRPGATWPSPAAARPPPRPITTSAARKSPACASACNWARASDLAPRRWSPPAATPGADAAAALSQRLVALDADARLQGMAAYERLRARQSVDALANVRKSDRPHAIGIAQRRVETAELAAHTEALRRDVDRLDRERSELLVEASRQEAERARQEAERLRFEAQIQMEEAQRLRAPRRPKPPRASRPRK
jgi:hypothetical protein